MPKTNYKSIALKPDYIPSEKEEYMNQDQLAYFYNMLLEQKEEAEQIAESILENVKNKEKAGVFGVGDDSDNSNAELEITKNLRLSQRNANKLKKIAHSLDMMEKGTYGYSVISGDPIGLKRMMARPLATVTIEEQEELEKQGL